MKNRSLSWFATGLVLFALAAMDTAVAADEALEQEALSLLTQYLRIDTTNPPGNEIRAAEFFKAIFDREGTESRTFESEPGRGNIYARIKRDGPKKAAVLMSHRDVLPVARRPRSPAPLAPVLQAPPSLGPCRPPLPRPALVPPHPPCSQSRQLSAVHVDQDVGPIQTRKRRRFANITQKDNPSLPPMEANCNG